MSLATSELGTLVDSGFGCIPELRPYHLSLVESMHHLQRREHPLLKSVIQHVHDALFGLKILYLGYFQRCPAAIYKAELLIARDLACREAHEVSVFSAAFPAPG